MDLMRASAQMAGTSRSRSRPSRVAVRLAGWLVLAACWTLVLLLGAATWAPHATRFKTDIIVGRSMEPSVPLYSVIVVEPVAPETIRSGDVITYQQPNEPERTVTHRVVGVERADDGRPAFVTRGDANQVRDPYRVTYEDTGYRMRTHVPHVGRALIRAQTREARVLLVVLPVLLLLTQFLRWLWRPDEPQAAEPASEEDVREDDWIAA